MTTRQEALIEIADIVKNHDLTLDEIAAALKKSPEQTIVKSGSVLTRIFGYLGGILVFAGLGVFASMVWEDIGAIGRILITLGTGFCAFVMALACIADERYEKASTPLFLIAAFLQPGGIFVVLDEFSRGGDPAHGVLFMSFVMLLQQGLTFWAKQRTVLAVTSTFFGGTFFAVAFDLLDVPDNVIGLTLGTAILCIAWALSNSRHRAIAPLHYFFGSILLLVAVYDIVERKPYEIAFLGISCGLIYMATAARSRTLLVVGTLSTLCYIVYFSGEHFADSLGWPITLILLGFVLIGFSSFAVKLNNKYIKQQG